MFENIAYTMAKNAAPGIELINDLYAESRNDEWKHILGYCITVSFWSHPEKCPCGVAE